MHAKNVNQLYSNVMFEPLVFTFPHKLTRQYVNDNKKIMVKTTRRRSIRTAAYHIV